MVSEVSMVKYSIMGQSISPRSRKHSTISLSIKSYELLKLYVFLFLVLELDCGAIVELQGSNLDLL